MNVKDLLFFNKEGYAMNANYNEDMGLWSSKILFDKNSTDTYKTQGMYLFEKIQKTNNTFNVDLTKYQIFNTNDFNFYPKSNIDSIDITKIETTNDSSIYNTKWIYGDNIEKYFTNKSYCYFENLNTFHNTDFDIVVGTNLEQNIFKILAVELGRILIFTTTTNDNPITNSLPTTAKIVPINIIEVKQLTVTVINFINETLLNGGLYRNKKLSVVTGTNNDSVYTVENVCEQKTKEEYLLTPGLYSPNSGDVLNLELELRTSNLVISNGLTQFAVPGTNEMTLPYIPQFLNVGDTVRTYSNNSPLILGNDVALIILNIDYDTNVITVDQPLSVEVKDCKLVLTSNVFKMNQEIVRDNMGNYSLPLTYWTIVNKYKDELLSLNGGFKLTYDVVSDSLIITSDYNDSYAILSVYYTDSLGVNTPLTGFITNTYDIYPIYVKEQIEEELELVGDASIYNRKIEFTTIDSFGLNININGKDYNMPTDIPPVSNTINDWMVAYQTELADTGIIVSSTATNINIKSEFPNVPIYTKLNFGNSTVYEIPYKDIQFNNIKSQLLININDQEYIVPFNTTDDNTVGDWVSMYKNILIQYGVIISNNINILSISLLDPEQELNISYNIGYIPKSGDLSVYETLFATNNNGSIITGNEIECLSSDNFLNSYAIGQKISISGASKIPQNRSYNIIGIDNKKIHLSYQGSYWNESNISVSLQSDFFIRRPKTGLSSIGNNGKLLWSWKDTVSPDFFLYDFSGDQLKHEPNFPAYNGPKPLCGLDGEIELKLNKYSNKDLDNISNPLKQQTIFNTIEHDLNYIDTTENPNIEPMPLQTFIGYNSTIEGWNKSRLYLEMIEDVSYSAFTNSSNDFLWTFKENYVELINSTGLNFIQLGFTKNQIIEFTFNDITDNKDLATLKNAGIQYRIQEVTPKKITFTSNVVEELSIKDVPSSIRPYYDSLGDPIYETRYLNVTIKVLSRVIAYFDIFGESEEEDERHKINLNNKNKNILKLQDFFIFKDVDIKEEGIDWIFLNRKRKELLEIYPEISNYLGSYKSIIRAINFFGYNDLTFTEYYQNIDPDNSTKFGKLFNLELLNIFDKSTRGWTLSNLNYQNMRSLGYKKTNLFSLNYSITDKDGNFIDAYSPEEVKIKLLGLKGWLTNNLLPIGTKIIDVNGKYIDQNNFKYTHDTHINRNFNVEEYSSPIDFKVEGYKYPISNGSDLYNISVQFFSFDNIDWFQYTIKTFYLDEWNTSTTYLINDIVLFNSKFYKSNTNISVEQEPGLATSWNEISLNDIPNVQTLQDYRTGSNLNTSFDINKTIDPHFVIETSWHSGYANTYKISKSYSVIYGFFDNI